MSSSRMEHYIKSAVDSLPANIRKNMNDNVVHALKMTH